MAQRGKTGGPTKAEIAAIPIPRWVKPSANCWVEIFDTTEATVVGYSQAIINSVDAEKKTVSLLYEKDQNGPPDIILTSILERADEPQMDDDLVDIDTLNDAELLRSLEVRFKQNQIYCFCGPSLLSTNPYKDVSDGYDPNDNELYKRYALMGGKKVTKPHINNMAAIVFRQLMESRGERDQAICISGESGAGKSHSTKLCLGFITQLFSEKTDKKIISIEDKILSCNPIMECFGNAKTIMNNDSSRFGKYFILYVDLASKQIKGSKIENYLLEKSRVVKQAETERNYHIFYALLKNMTDEEQVKYHLSDQGKASLSEFNFLNHSKCYDVPEINDEKNYSNVRESLKNLDFAKEEQDGIWKILSIILNLSNVQIDSSCYLELEQACSLIDSKYLTRSLELLGLDKQTLVKGLCYKKTGEYDVVITPMQSEGIKDALTKDLYNSLFNWIVIKLNVNLLPPTDKKLPSIGLLDIFGFEDFKINSMEQLCINYTNEKLQKLYIFCVFIAEKKIFEEENLGQHSDKIKTNENVEVLRLFEATMNPSGLFQIIDSACIMYKDNQKADDGLVSELHNQHSKNPLVTFDKMKPNLLSIRHTAKKVLYSTDKFAEKNRDELPRNLYETMAKADKVIYRIFKQKLTDEEVVLGEKEEKNLKVKKTLVAKFKSDMEGLMKKLESSECNFIRCLKPNGDKVPDLWDGRLFLTQIKYMGILDSIKVRRESYPLRKAYKEFYGKYQDLDSISPERTTSFLVLSKKTNVDWKQLCENLVKSVEKKTPPQQVLFGKTRIFMNIVYANKLEELLEDVQKYQRNSLNKIVKAFQVYDFISQWNKHRLTSIKVINFAKMVLVTWNSKVENYRFRQFLKVVLHCQHRFRLTLYKRNLRLKAYSSQVIGRSFQLYRMRQTLMSAKKKIAILSSAILKMRFRLFMVRVKINKTMLDVIFENAWKEIQGRMSLNACKDIQRIFRGHFTRIARFDDVEKLATIRESIVMARAGRTMVRITRGFLVRARLNRMQRAARYLQGFLRMKMLVKYLRLVKISVRKIQHAVKRYIIRMRAVDLHMNRFMRRNKEFMPQIKNIEHDIVFHQQESLFDLKNLDNYTKVKFFEDSRDFREFIPRIDSFVPPPPAIDLNPKMRLFSLVIDFDCYVDTSDVYGRSWAVDFLNYLNVLSKKNSRLLHLEVGETFTLAVDDDLKLYSWGLNDFGQLGRTTKVTKPETFFPAPTRVTSNLFPRVIASGDDHSIMVDYSNNVYVWGSNTSGQLGLGHPRDIPDIVHLKSLGTKTKMIASKGNRNYLITQDGVLFAWPNPDDPINIYQPIQAPLSEPTARFTNVSCGRNFAMAISTDGVLFGFGGNKYGQLGQGDTRDRKRFTAVDSLRNYGEKISEVSCGIAHTICQTNTDKVFVWGMGSKGQLGCGDTRHATLPLYIRVQDSGALTKARSIQAGALSSYILLDNKKVYHSGLISKSEQCNLEFKVLEVETKALKAKYGQDLIPMKLYSKWSKSISVTYLIIADFRKVKVTTGIRDKIADQVHSKWEEVYNQVLPPFTDAIYKNICPKYVRKIHQVQEKTITLDNYDRSQKNTLMNTKLGNESLEESKHKENTVKMKASSKKSQASFSKSDFNDPITDKSYGNLYTIRQRLEKLLALDESEWTAEDKLLISSLNKL
jgi:myosin-5